ncbi:MAG: alanine--glyoxylate aminotransferase [Gammaproteobacteria bacterium RIFCSPLOWO2_02_FULL_52_10]|nr:MAG: alanine--glyoxylate aminotransferase [Gammaproteobacteria bacterium RIFCSPLOWO2_12_FULL_52_10]OGT82608.1 MAG: alanine--glyoxylate aminotransferase [Gammaproteobacteria bacterium RIFCSPLOWO2_02_FULL_52_10]
MGPGPSDVSQRVLDAMARPTIGHMDPEFIVLMEETKELLRYAFQTDYEVTFPVSAPGSAGMEICFVNLVEPGDKVIICQNGVFGGRMKENVERCGGVAVVVNEAWGAAIDPGKVEEQLLLHPDAKILAYVQAETSTGVLSDAKTLAEIGQRFGCLTIVDTVTSLGGSKLKVKEWGLDAVYSGSQKCLSCIPGLAPVTFSSKAIAKIKQRTKPVQSWFLDLNLILGYWNGESKRTYHHTAPINAIYGLHEALLMLKKEGIENSWARHTQNYEALRDGIEAMGLQFKVAEDQRLPQLNAVMLPKGVDDLTVRNRLLHEHNLEIGAGLGALAGKIWRIGLMGHGSNQKNVLFCLEALNSILKNLGAYITPDICIDAAIAAYAKQEQVELG